MIIKLDILLYFYIISKLMNLKIYMYINDGFGNIFILN